MADSGLKITKRFVDPITFSCRVSVAHIPRIEDSDHETTCFELVQPHVRRGSLRDCGGINGLGFDERASPSSSSMSKSSSPSGQKKSRSKPDGFCKSSIKIMDDSSSSNDSTHIKNESEKKYMFSPKQRAGCSIDFKRKKVVVLRGGTPRNVINDDDEDETPLSFPSRSPLGSSDNRKLGDKKAVNSGINSSSQLVLSPDPRLPHPSPKRGVSNRKHSDEKADDIGFNSPSPLVVPPPTQLSPLSPVAVGKEATSSRSENSKSVAYTVIQQQSQSQVAQKGRKKRILLSPRKKVSCKNKSNKDLSPCAFLHNRNSADQVIGQVLDGICIVNKQENNIDGDRASIGSQSIASPSARSYAERSKSEASLATKAKTRRLCKTPELTSTEGVGHGGKSSILSPSSNSRQSVVSPSSVKSRHSEQKQTDEDLILAMKSIDEKSITKFKSQCLYLTISPLTMGSPKGMEFKKAMIKEVSSGSLGILLSQAGFSNGDDDDDDDTNDDDDDEDEDDDNDDNDHDNDHNHDDDHNHRSTATASAIGSKSLSPLSRIEQSVLVKELRMFTRTDRMSNQNHDNTGSAAPLVAAAQPSILSPSSDKRTLTPDAENTSKPSNTKPSVAETKNKPNVPAIESIFLSGDHDDDQSLNAEDIGPVGKKLRFKDGHSERGIPELTDSMYDDLFYTSEEIANFRYEAFMVQAGLDMNDFL